jgi:probable phosphoglycerate mutase
VIAFVRHGQTAVNRAGQLQGRADAPLTDAGARQAAELGAWFATQPVPARIVSSPLLRARATADAIAAAVGIDVETDDRLVELDYGEWDERPLAEIPPSSWAEWRADPHFAPPGGESLLDVTARVVTFCTDTLTASPEEVVVAVSHVSPIKAAVCWALGVGVDVSWRMHLDLASVTQIGARGERAPYLASYNELRATRP